MLFRPAPQGCSMKLAPPQVLLNSWQLTFPRPTCKSQHQVPRPTCGGTIQTALPPSPNVIPYPRPNATEENSH